jgi:integrase
MLKSFLIESVRLTGERKPILVVDPARFEGFIQEIATTTEIPEPYRTLIAILITGGLRVSEGLALRKRDFFMGDDGLLYFKSPVLKKGSKLKRTCLVHPSIQPLVQARLDSVRHYDALFPYNRKTIWRVVNKALGDDACPHSIARHSYISWLLHEKKITALEASRVVEVKVSTIEAYNHPNVKARLKNLFGVKAA